MYEGIRESDVRERDTTCMNLACGAGSRAHLPYNARSPPGTFPLHQGVRATAWRRDRAEARRLQTCTTKELVAEGWFTPQFDLMDEILRMREQKK